MNQSNGKYRAGWQHVGFRIKVRSTLRKLDALASGWGLSRSATAKRLMLLGLRAAAADLDLDRGQGQARLSEQKAKANGKRKLGSIEGGDRQLG